MSLLALGCAAGVTTPASAQALGAGRELSGWELRGPAEAIGTVRSLVNEGELSLYSDGDEPTRRIPLGRRGRALLGGEWLPYATIRPSGPLLEGETASAAGLHGVDTRRDLARGLDVGAGLSWNLSEGLSLFGEYRFLPIRPSSTVVGDAHGREGDSSELKGGIHLRF